MVEAGKETNNVKLGQGPEKIKRFKSWGTDRRDKDWKKKRDGKRKRDFKYICMIETGTFINKISV